MFYPSFPLSYVSHLSPHLGTCFCIYLLVRYNWVKKGVSYFLFHTTLFTCFCIYNKLFLYKYLLTNAAHFNFSYNLLKRGY